MSDVDSNLNPIFFLQEAPIIVSPATQLWNLEIGTSATLTPPIYTGDPGTVTWTLLRDGVPVGGQTNRTEAQAEAYVAVAADIGPASVVWRATVTNAFGSADSTPLLTATWAPVANAIAAGARCVLDPALGIVLSGADVSTWADQTPAAQDYAVGTGTAPLFIASDAGFNNQPVVQSDGGTEWMRRVGFDFGGSVTAFGMLLVMRVDAATNGDRWLDYNAGEIAFLQAAGPVPQGLTTGGGSATSTGTTNLAGARLVGFDWAAGGNQRIIYGGAVEDTDANTHLAIADDATMGLFAGSAGANTSAISVGYAIILNQVISAAFLANFYAYCQFRFAIP